MLPENLRAQSVLECHLLGGPTPWESYYCVPERGQADETWAHTNYPYLLKAAEGCGYTGAVSDPFSFFGQNSAGEDIFFGPHFYRLQARPDVLRRMRVVVTRHRANIHDFAIPLVATGREQSQAKAAALATHVSRYFVDREPDALRVAPFASVIGGAAGFTLSGGGDNFAILGPHPAEARPFYLLLSNQTAAARFQRLVDRTTVGSSEQRAQYDALLGLYFEQYAQRLRVGGTGAHLRAKGFAGLERAFGKQTHLQELQSLLTPSDFAPLSTPKACSEVVDSNGLLGFSQSDFEVLPGSAGNLPAMRLKLATRLLTDPDHALRYCMITDTGVQEADGGGGYDTHRDGPWRQATNFDNLLHHLLDSINAPGEANPNKLDLDKTMIILTSEMGRAIGRQSTGSQGRSHWPHGFAQIFIGGPIGAQQGGVYGHIDEAGYATQFTTPAENRIAALLALGIYPFSSDAFGSGEVQGQAEEGAAARDVIKRFFGLDV
jgi:hypothetical protein